MTTRYVGVNIDDTRVDALSPSLFEACDMCPDERQRYAFFATDNLTAYNTLTNEVLEGLYESVTGNVWEHSFLERKALIQCVAYYINQQRSGKRPGKVNIDKENEERALKGEAILVEDLSPTFEIKQREKLPWE